MSVSAEVRRHWARVAKLPCMVCGYAETQIAHAHGPTLRARNPAFLKPKGKKMAWQHWLVLPLCPACHAWADNDTTHFDLFWPQAGLLDTLCAELNVDVWARARAALKPCAVRESV